jgi:hypothetical protein
VLAGSGRARVVTGEPERDRRFERLAADSDLDLELVADEPAAAGDIAAVFGEALARALAAS